MNPEEANETWRPIQTVESILLSVISMFSDPNFSSPANVDASVQNIIFQYTHNFRFRWNGENIRKYSKNMWKSLQRKEKNYFQVDLKCRRFVFFFLLHKFDQKYVR